MERSANLATTAFEQQRDQRAQAERRRWHLRRAMESRTGLLTSLILARWTISLAARSEGDPEVRRMRRNILMERWSRYMGSITNTPLGAFRI
ncbi:MAG TPA: hypothetical protein VLF91_03890 [Candidatus Saccharimonadales bacterium]|nr:hypothetical protein [Candidatus Saccharimonadales bacterium]